MFYNGKTASVGRNSSRVYVVQARAKLWKIAEIVQ